MLYIETDNRDAAFHFSVEEHIMRSFTSDEPVVMIWRTRPCVMLDNYQIPDAEIDMMYAKEAGIQVVRRSSGGGAIFTDSGTLLFTMILPPADVRYLQQIAKEMIAGLVVGALNHMGIPAKAEGRNDILIEGKKVSGMAQYVRHGRICTHGSLLYSADLETLARVLRADSDKIRSKAVSSVRSRVTNLMEYTGAAYSILEFKELLKRNLFADQQVRNYELSHTELAQVDQIYHDQYGNPSWTIGRTPRFSFRNSKRFAGGKVEVFLDVRKGEVASCSICGDFLGTVPIRHLEEHLERRAFLYQSFDSALSEISLAPFLGDITKDQLLSCLFE
ncbi:MAG: lipoate--protein ligase [Clostridia bacterium]|nr:lipoate--protein ligase [Clostridia bacterium]